jgi:hypothetical protein
MKKLKLKKELIANLTEQDQVAIKGGDFTFTHPILCTSGFCPKSTMFCVPKPEEPTPVTTDTGGCSQWTEATCQP